MLTPSLFMIYLLDKSLERQEKKQKKRWKGIFSFEMQILKLYLNTGTTPMFIILFFKY